MNFKRFSFIALIIILLFLVVVLIGQAQTPALVIIVSMISTTIAVATPLTLGALSGLFCERSGVVNIGIEGMMLTSAFFGWFASIYLNSILKVSAMPSLILGVVVAILVGGLLGLFHAWLSVTFKVDQIIGGTVINIIAVGITGFLNRQIFFTQNSVFGGQVPHAPGTLPRIKFPRPMNDPAFFAWLDENTVLFTILIIILILLLAAVIILLGITSYRLLRLYRNKATRTELTKSTPRNVLIRYTLYLLFILLIAWVLEEQPIATSAVLLMVISSYIMFETRWGLRTRSVGENPRAADTVGISVEKMRYWNVIIGGCLAGLGGAYFTLESVPSFEPLMTNGRGFIALAALIFGNWTPLGAWAASLVFGAAQAFQINLQIYREAIPPQWTFLQYSYVVGMVPYILTMVILTGLIGKNIPPAADGVPYEK